MAAVAAVVVVEEVTQTGTTTIPAFTPADSQEVETILQPIPAGISI